MTRRIVVVTAGLSQPSTTRLLADQLAAAATAAVGGRGESAHVDVVELRDLAADLATAMTTGGLARPALAAAQQLVEDADGLVVVTPVFAASYSGLFKMFFDTLDPDVLEGVPVLIAATAGTPRHSLVLDHAMRPLFTYLHAVVVPTGVFAATEDFGDGDAAGLTRRIGRAAAEFAALLVAQDTAVRGFAPQPGEPLPAADAAAGPGFRPFADLLRGHAG
jgi:FMN reductase